MVSKLKVQFYGIMELDSIRDSTQSFNEVAGNAAVAREGSYAQRHARWMFGARNSRFGFKITGPESPMIKTSAVAEVDFLGNQPGTPPAFNETSYFVSPTMRMRHFYVKIDTPVVDITAGQTWQLFGWQAAFSPASVQIQGLPGQVFGRAPQLRLSHTFKTDSVNVELAVAAVRPSQRESRTPDGQAGIRLLVNDWKGRRTAGGANTSLDSAAVGVSGAARHFSVNEHSSAPVLAHGANGWGLSLDAFIPVVPATKTSYANALSLTGSFSTGTGISDLYSALSGGISFPKLPPDNTTFAANIDNGPVTYDANGKLHTIDWRAFIVGLQYYLPVGGLWVSGNYSETHSGNISDYGAAPASVYTDSRFYDGNLFWDVTEQARVGAEYARVQQTYADDKKTKNDRFQLSVFYVF